MRTKGFEMCRTLLEEEGFLRKVLSYVSPFHLWRLRRVCKLWNAVIHLSSFKESSSKQQELAIHANDPRGLWLVMARKPAGSTQFARELIAFDFASTKWISMGVLLTESCSPDALEALGGSSFRLVANPQKTGSENSLYSHLMATGSPTGGLACFLCSPFDKNADGENLVEFEATCDSTPRQAFDCEAYYLVVLNPLTGSHSILPPPLKHTHWLQKWGRKHFLKISLQTLSYRHYRVFLTSRRNQCPGDLEIYDSHSRSWRAGQSCWQHDEAKVGGKKELEQADLLHFAYSSPVSRIYAYKEEQDEWTQTEVYGQLPRLSSWWFVENWALIRHRGRVLLAAVQFHGDFAVEGFTIWEFDPDAKAIPDDAMHGGVTAEWVEVARTPLHLCNEVGSRNQYEMSVRIVACANLVCMTGVHNPLYDARYHAPVVYDLDEDLWYDLPVHEGRYDMTAVFGMRPNLVAVA